LNINTEAAMTLGSFTSIQLKEILNIFVENFVKLSKKEKEVLSFVQYQFAMKYFDFNLEDDERIEITISYLQLVKEKLSQIQKGRTKLYPELFATLRKIFNEVLKFEDQKRLKEWKNYVSKKGEVTFWGLFKDLYGTLSKDLTKKYRLQCLEVLPLMLARSPQEFYFLKSPNNVDELYKHMTVSFKSKAEKYSILAHFTEYIRLLSPETIKKDIDRFNKYLTSTFQLIFVKSTKFTEEESKIVDEFIMQSSRKSLETIIKLYEEYIDIKKSYTNEQRICLLVCLHKISLEQHKELQNFNYLLGIFTINIRTIVNKLFNR
jgi:hypothetical protein